MARVPSIRYPTSAAVYNVARNYGSLTCPLGSATRGEVARAPPFGDGLGMGLEDERARALSKPAAQRARAHNGQ